MTGSGCFLLSFHSATVPLFSPGLLWQPPDCSSSRLTRLQIPILTSERHMQMLNWPHPFSLWNLSMAPTSCRIKWKFLSMTSDALQIWPLPPQLSPLSFIPGITGRSLTPHFLPDRSICTPSVSPVSSIHLMSSTSYNHWHMHAQSFSCV